MRKITLLSTLTLFLLACSVTSLPFIEQTAPPAPSETPIPFPTETFTPAVPPTYTFTPTLIGAKPTETPTETPVPTDQILYLTPPTLTPIIPTVEPITPTSALIGTGFLSLSQSVDLFYSGSCNPNQVTITVEMLEPARVASVELFVRFRNKDNGDTTGWNKGLSLDNVGGATYTIILQGREMGIDTANNWLMYQLVATDKNGKEVARTPVFPQSLTLTKCP